MPLSNSAQHLHNRKRTQLSAIISRTRRRDEAYKACLLYRLSINAVSELVFISALNFTGLAWRNDRFFCLLTSQIRFPQDYISQHMTRNKVTDISHNYLMSRTLLFENSPLENVFNNMK
ncbi:hypothetical protein ONS96_005595 [Cadophora gregata f. sp. sojae]|nr:hypothetical protein ONS96_005595 [Cadophora gregata f. sp. sojae]